MKKLLLTVALVLAVVTSLVAGTMAAYTQTLDETSNPITAKTFNLTDSMSANYKQDLKVAPGGTYSYTVTIENDGEVDAIIKMNASLANATGKTAIQGLVVNGISGLSNISGTVASDGKSVALTTVGNSTSGVLKAGQSATITFNLKWPYVDSDAANARDNADKGAASSVFELSYNATGAEDATVTVD
ncbi:MAG: hypothetical protein LLF75_01445 [Eubacteriales bacterium]|nr:hypothetical protein [Eubacteriales bacterium]